MHYYLYVINITIQLLIKRFLDEFMYFNITNIRIFPFLLYKRLKSHKMRIIVNSSCCYARLISTLSVMRKKLVFIRSINVCNRVDHDFLPLIAGFQVISLKHTDLKKSAHKFCLNTNIAKSSLTAERSARLYIFIN